jgi:hypothetical protein
MRPSLLVSLALISSTAFLSNIAQAQTDAGPTTQPTMMAYPPRAANAVGVMLLPFRLVGTGTDGGWVSQALGQHLQNVLLENAMVSLTPPPAELPTNTGGALEAGLYAQDKYVVYGTYQITDGQLSVNGAIISIAWGRTIAPLAATGDLHDLTRVEDALAAQIATVMPQPPSPPADMPLFANGAPQVDLSAVPDQAYGVAQDDAYPYGSPLFYGGGLLYSGIGYYGGVYGGGPYGYGPYGYGGVSRSFNYGRSYSGFGSNRGFHTTYRSGVPFGVGIGAPATHIGGFYGVGGIHGGGFGGRR